MDGGHLQGRGPKYWRRAPRIGEAQLDPKTCLICAVNKGNYFMTFVLRDIHNTVSIPNSPGLCADEFLKIVSFVPCTSTKWMAILLHPRKWRTRASVLTGGPGAAPGGVASKNGWVYMRVQGGFISYSYFGCLCAVAARMAVGPSKKSATVCRGESRNELCGLKLGGSAMRGAVPWLSADLTTHAV